MCALLNAGCEKNRAPNGDIPHDKMKLVVRDLMLANAAGQYDVFPGVKNMDSLNAGLYATVLAKHGIAKEDFVNCYREYESRPEWMDTLYFGVIEALVEEQTRQTGTQSTPPKP